MQSQFGHDERIPVGPDRIEQVGAAQAVGGPNGVRPDDRVRVAQGAGQGFDHGRISTVGRIAEHDQGVAAHITELAARYVPPADQVLQRGIVGLEQSQSGHGRLGAGFSLRRGSASLGPQVGRAAVLAGIATVQTVAEGDPVVARKGSGGLHQPRQATSGIELTGADERARGAVIDAAVARPASVLDRQRGPSGCDGGVGHHRADHEPGSRPRQQHIAVLPIPAEAGPHGRRPVHQSVVVYQYPGLPTRRDQPVRHGAQGAAQGPVVIHPRVAGHPPGPGSTGVGSSRA